MIILAFFIHKTQEGYVQPKETTYSTQTIAALTAAMKKNAVPDAAIDPYIKAYQKTGTPEASATSYITNGLWPYSTTAVDVVNHTGSFIGTPIDISTYQKVYPEETLYNILSVTSGKNNIAQLATSKIGCKVDASGNYIGTGMYALDDSNVATGDPLDNTTLPTKIPGFQFLGDACNPCNILNNQYDCPFAISGQDKNPLLPSPGLQFVWGIFPTAASAAIASISSPASPTQAAPTPIF